MFLFPFSRKEGMFWVVSGGLIVKWEQMWIRSEKVGSETPQTHTRLLKYCHLWSYTQPKHLSGVSTVVCMAFLCRDLGLPLRLCWFPASWKVFCWAPAAPPEGHGFLKVLECLSHPFGQEKTGGEAGTPIACVGPYVALTWSKVSSNPSYASISQPLLWVLSNTDGEPVHVTMCLVSFGHGKSLSGLCWVCWSI